MKHPLSEKEIVSASNRPDLRKRKEGILVHDEGFTGWGRIRRLNAYKGTLREGDFHHEYSRFADLSEVEEER
jgi:hypothetical protein